MLSLIFFIFSPSAMAQIPSTDQFWNDLSNNDVPRVIADIRSGISPDDSTDTETPLSYSIKAGSIEMVKALLENGANVNLQQPISLFTPLMVAAKHEKPEAAQLLVSHGADANLSGILGRGPLNIAALFDSIKVAEILLSQTNADVNARGKLCPLAVASRQGYLEFVSLILQKARLNINDNCFNSAIDMAQYNHNDAVVSLLNSSKNR
jgi:hypothetical protein